MLPDVGLSMVAIMRSVVVFPAPFGPSKPNIRPGLHSKEILSTALEFGIFEIIAHFFALFFIQGKIFD